MTEKSQDASVQGNDPVRGELEGAFGGTPTYDWCEVAVPKECKICTHPECVKIESQIVAGMSGRKIASLCGVSEASVRRHKANHLPAKLANSGAIRRVGAGKKGNPYRYYKPLSEEE
jgi:hypothetical protein